MEAISSGQAVAKEWQEPKSAPPLVDKEKNNGSYRSRHAGRQGRFTDILYSS